MARARIIKPGFFKNEILAECSLGARLLFAGLWTLADREGRLEDRPKRIKADILPYDDIDADALLNELARNGFIVRYEANNDKYIQILTFTDHQKPHQKETASKIPAPDKPQPKPGKAVPKPDEPGLNLNPLTLNLNPETPKPPEGAFAVPNPFAVWYENYPHKVGRAAAEKAFWKAIKLADLDELLDGIEKYKKSKPPDRPWCNPATWLNQQRWKDEPNEITGKNSGKSVSQRADEATARALARFEQAEADSSDSPPMLRHS